ncbi:MAG: VWA domain-containing protein, partial [Nanoarchaeota archaeon]|nr:VWA domain-containing protein [Nanoarchaeota archaeon]
MKGDVDMKKIAKIFVVVALASFSASLAHSQEVYTSNVVILLDASGSMDRTMRDARGKNVRRIDAAKSGIYEVLKQVPDTTNVGILALIAKDSTDYDKSRIWVYPLGKKDDAKLRKALELVEPYGNTPLGTFAKIGADRLIQERVKQHNSGSFKLLIATDGEANEEPSDRVDKYILDIISKGIRVDVIGVAMKSKHTLATNAHSYRRADDPASLTKAIKEVVLAEISPKVNPELAKELNDDVAGFP